MGFRDAVSSVPAKPIIAAALGITVLAGAWHGWNVRSVCLDRAGRTAALHEWAKTAIAGLGAGFRLDSVTDFEWDQVRISQGDKKTGSVRDCPFDWHWSNEQRDRMAQAGDLTLIGFFSAGRLVAMVDFDRRWARFDTGPEPIIRGKAVFSGAPGTNVLRLTGPARNKQP